MSKYFRVRHAVPVTIADVTHTFYARELGYIEFEELKQATEAKLQDADKDRRGLALMAAVVLACIENEDGASAYTEADWKTEIKQVVLTVGKAAMKAQGYDMDAVAEPQEPLTAEQAEGNA